MPSKTACANWFAAASWTLPPRSAKSRWIGSGRTRSTSTRSGLWQPRRATGRAELRIAEVHRIAEVLQFPVVIDGERSLPFELERFQKLDFVLGGVAAQGLISEKLSEAGFHRNRRLGSLFHKFESPEVPRSHSAVEPDFHIERIQLDIPALNQNIEKRNRALDRRREDIRMQQLAGHCLHLLLGPLAEPGRQTQPPFILRLM